MKVFFFGAGASKACGLPLTSELMSALYSPWTFGINVQRSKYQGIIDQFDKDWELSTTFVESIRGSRQLSYQVLAEIFGAIAKWENHDATLNSSWTSNTSAASNAYDDALKAIVLCRLSASHIPAIRSAFTGAFSVLLNPAYYLDCDSLSYMRFVEWASKQDEYIVLLTTNWDYLLDNYVDLFYGIDRVIDEGMVNLDVDMLIPEIMLSKEVKGRAISLYKLNGSLNWLYCPTDRAFYGSLFQPPYNLTATQILQSTRVILYLRENPENEIPGPLIPGNCPNCGTCLEYRLYTPGVSRSTFPIAPRMMHYSLFAVEHCDELTFIGFSCPEEDKDLMQLIGEALRRNAGYMSGAFRPTVVQTPGPHRDETIRRFEDALGSSVNYREDGFHEWVESLWH